MPAITILLANAQPIIRSSLRSLLEGQSDLRVVAEAANGREAVVLADYKRPDVVVLDMNLPVLPAVDAVREILALNKRLAIVFHSSYTDEEYVSAAFKAGARAYVAADSEAADLVTAIRAVASGGRYLGHNLTCRLPDGQLASGTQAPELDSFLTN